MYCSSSINSAKNCIKSVRARRGPNAIPIYLSDCTELKRFLGSSLRRSSSKLTTYVFFFILLF